MALENRTFHLLFKPDILTSYQQLMYAAIVLLAYFIGGLPFGYLFVRFSLGKDVRTMGSGNIGATNVHRTAGHKAGLIVLLLDIAKGWTAVWIAGLMSHNDQVALALAAVAVMIGHCYPVFLRFRGGKAVACYVGAFLYLAPLSLLAVSLVFVLTVALSKYISLASIVSALVFPFAVWAITNPQPPIVISSAFASLLIIFRHKGNISRLRQGTEHVFSLKGAK